MWNLAKLFRRHRTPKPRPVCPDYVERPHDGYGESIAPPPVYVFPTYTHTPHVYQLNPDHDAYRMLASIVPARCGLTMVHQVEGGMVHGRRWCRETYGAAFVWLGERRCLKAHSMPALAAACAEIIDALDEDDDTINAELDAMAEAWREQLRKEHD